MNMNQLRRRRSKLLKGRMMTIKETSEKLGIGRHRLARALRTQQICGIHVGRRFVIPEYEVNRLLRMVRK